MSESQAHETKHPSDMEYVKIGLILAAVTAAEVAVYYVPSLRRLLVPILVVMAVVKFTLVVAWFMHLKFDARMFRRLFLLGLILAFLVFGIALATFLTVIPDS